MEIYLDQQRALPLLNLLDLLTVTNIYKLQLLNFTHQWHSKKLPNIFNQHFCYASEVHTYNTRYASKSNFYKPRSRTNIGKQTTAAMVTELWQQLPTHIKDLSTYNFPKTLKEYLLAEQLTHWNYFYFNHNYRHVLWWLFSLLFFCHLSAFFFFFSLVCVCLKIFCMFSFCDVLYIRHYFQRTSC